MIKNVAVIKEKSLGPLQWHLSVTLLKALGKKGLGS